MTGLLVILVLATAVLVALIYAIGIHTLRSPGYTIHYNGQEVYTPFKRGLLGLTLVIISAISVIIGIVVMIVGFILSVIAFVFSLPVQVILLAAGRRGFFHKSGNNWEYEISSAGFKKKPTSFF